MNEIARSWPAEAETLLGDLVSLRRAIHREPELGLQNPKTLAKIKGADDPDAIYALVTAELDRDAA